MSGQAPIVSVVMPVFNDEQHLGETLASLAGQTLRDIEVICVDDGSSDASPRILADMAERDSRFTVITKENGGPSASRHAGEGAVRGTYVYYLDSDDPLEPDALERVANAMNADNLDILRVETRSFADSPEFSEATRIENVTWDRRPEISGPVTGLELIRAMLDARCFQVMTWLYVSRTQYLVDEGITWPPIQTTEDQGFTQRSLIMAPRAGFLPGPIHRRRVRKGSYSRSGESAVYMQQRFLTAFETADMFIEWEERARQSGDRGLIDVARKTGIDLVQRQIRFIVRVFRVHGREGLGDMREDPRVQAILPMIERIADRAEDVETFTAQAEILSNRYDVLSERFPYNAVVRLKSAATVLFRR